MNYIWSSLLIFSFTLAAGFSSKADVSSDLGKFADGLTTDYNLELEAETLEQRVERIEVQKEQLHLELVSLREDCLQNSDEQVSHRVAVAAGLATNLATRMKINSEDNSIILSIRQGLLDLSGRSQFQTCHRFAEIQL